MRWREIKELTGMALLLGILFAVGAGVSTAVGESRGADAADTTESVENGLELESVQAAESVDPVLWPSGV